MGKIGFCIRKGDNIGWLSACRELLEKRGHTVTLLEYTGEVEEGSFAQAQLWVCLNLAAYDAASVVEIKVLNLIPCKVYHLITEKECRNEEALQEVISMAHFFFCTDKEKAEEMPKHYPNIPYMEWLGGWGEEDDKNGVLLADSICRVLKMCYIDEA